MLNIVRNGLAGIFGATLLDLLDKSLDVRTLGVKCSLERFVSTGRALLHGTRAGADGARLAGREGDGHDRDNKGKSPPGDQIIADYGHVHGSVVGAREFGNGNQGACSYGLYSASLERFFIYPTSSVFFLKSMSVKRRWQHSAT